MESNFKNVSSRVDKNLFLKFKSRCAEGDVKINFLISEFIRAYVDGIISYSNNVWKINYPYELVDDP